ncbi:polymorphic toxin-type HINT domain-containing protein [Streptomyces seoulensis]|uniref:polymorphic toxin-type HINT domain-containing protein n=1 Tax=Streptomyces seoulensis TaxID=73044 RepID=UPI0033A5A834
MGTKGWGRVRSRTALVVSTVLVGTLLQGTLTSTVAQADDLPRIPASEKPVAGHHVAMKPRKRDGQPRTPGQTPKHAWPKAATATLTVPTAAASKNRSSTAEGVPLTLTAPAATGDKRKQTKFAGKATVRLLDHTASAKAGIDGPLFALTPQGGATSGTVDVHVNYSAFSQTFGGGYERRLTLVQLPHCALTTPNDRECTTPHRLTTHNDPKTHTLRADGVNLLATDTTSKGIAQPMVLAVTAGTSSDKGDYTASQLSPSAAWNTNLNTGDFTWSYDMPTPSVPGGFEPKVRLSYSSGSVDGRTANTNNQSSWAGDGFELWSGYIERSYKPCTDDDVTNADGKKPGDLCWAYDNATISFNGHAAELIPTSTADTFKIKGDDGTLVKRIYGTLTSNPRGNGAHNDEYWRVTTTDGSRYYFGYHKLPGWASGNETTDSTWTVPVYGDDTGEPCHGATFEESWCQQGWRWNLDLAIDVHGNAITYYYDKETNNYVRNIKPADKTPYTRGGTLDRIEYGLPSTSIYASQPLAKVDFTSQERCLPQTGVTCDPSTIDDKAFYWYDTPWDLNCKSGADCTTGTPSFWTRLRLTGITTQVRKADGTYAPVDEWKLDHRWGMSDTDYQLLLDYLQHTGKSTTPAITLPKVTFDYTQRPNRPDITGDDLAPFIKERLSNIEDEAGGQIDVSYSATACDPANPPTPQGNTSRCFPVYAPKPGHTDPQLQWFNKYVVDAVAQTDRTRSGAPDMVTRYTYLDGAAWHFDDNDGLTKEKYKTWSTYRGYGHVRVQTGGQDPVGMKSQTDHYFLRGMDGDKGATAPVEITNDDGTTIADHDSAAGYEYKTDQYAGPGGKVLAKTINNPWHYETAKRVRSWGTTTANLTGTTNTWTWTSLDDGAGSSWRKTYTSYAHETKAGRITLMHEAGDTGTSADNQCTRTTYVDNTSTWILTNPSRVETALGTCQTTPDRSKDVIADTRTAYDGQDYGAAPTKGDATRTATLKSHDGTTATYLESGATFDTYGRQLTATDITATVTATETTAPVRSARTDGRTTTTAYTPATGLLTSAKVTSPPATAGSSATAQSVTTYYDTLRGLPTISLDPNTKRTDTTYDALGRKLKIWLPDRSKANNDLPNYEFTYTTVEGKPVAIGTKTLKSASAQQTSYQLLDGFLRPRQIQTPGPNGGMVVSDTLYDERGLAAKTFAPYYNSATPGTDFLTLDNALEVETQTWNTYDGLGRMTKSQQIAGNSDNADVLASTLTNYDGDRVTVTPPKGATPTTTLLDVRGRPTELWQYPNATPTGTPDKTLYAYLPLTGPNPNGALTKLTDPAGNTWTYTYDQRGNQIEANDPDKGKTTVSYDDRSLATSTTEVERKKTVATVYDNLGRVMETREGSATGPLLTKNTWDPTGYQGQLASATRYDGTDAYTTSYGMYDALYRPNRTTITIPATTANGALAGTYDNTVRYNANGTVQSIGYPAAGALTAETITPTYDEVLRPKTLVGSGAVNYVTDTAYSLTGKPLQYTLQNGAKFTQVTNSYEWGTQRLSSSRVDRQDVPGVDKSATYAYDEAGNIHAITDVSRDGTDNQCFQYDYLDRLTEAWAQNTSACATTPSTNALGGPAPYWYSYGYDKTGNRKSQTLHNTAGDTSKDERRDYAYPTAGSARPHALSQVASTGPNGTSINSYTYDGAGNNDTRTVNGDKQTLTWSADDHLLTHIQPDASGGTKTTSYVYDANGNRLIRRTPTATTLYLGGTEITLSKGSTTPTAQRYYDLGGGNQAIRTNDNKVSFLIGDQHGTSELAINAVDLTMQQRRTTPFGGYRGTQPTNWPGEKTFVGGTQDPTGLIHLGAREYDPVTSRFLSVDPIIDPSDPQQLNAYAYANNNPVTMSDPNGLKPESLCGKEGHCGDTRETFTQDDEGKWTPHSRTAHMGAPRDDGSTVVTYTVADGDSRVTWKTTIGSGGEERLGVLPEGPDRRITALKDTFKALVFDYDLAGQCAHDVTWDCAWLAADIPFFKLAKAAKLGKLGKEAKVTEGILSACTKCFLAGTDVLMSNGKTKDIEDVKIGDKVLATDPKTGKSAAKKVTRLIVTDGDKHFNELSIATKDGIDKLTATYEHPLWSPSQHDWVQAGSLKPGMTLRTDKGDTVIITANRPYAQHARTYNLTVEGLHTYYVLAGETPVLVHNSGGCPDLDALSQSGMRPAKGKTTHAGREYQKHMNRGDLPVVPGKELKTAGQDLLDDILTNPQTATSAVNSGNFAGGTRYIMPDPAGGRGIGATFDANGQFQYFGRY